MAFQFALVSFEFCVFSTLCADERHPQTAFKRELQTNFTPIQTQTASELATKTKSSRRSFAREARVARATTTARTPQPPTTQYCACAFLTGLSSCSSSSKPRPSADSTPTPVRASPSSSEPRRARYFRSALSCPTRWTTASCSCSRCRPTACRTASARCAAPFSS